MLDDGDSGRARRVEFGNELEGGVRIVDVVVGKLLALQLRSRGDAGALFAGQIEASRLVRVLAIAHDRMQMTANGTARRGLGHQGFGEPAGNRRIIGGGAGIGLGSKALAEGIGQ